MMDWGLFWTFVGTIASLYGAYLAWDQASKAKKYSEIAKVVENNIKHHRITGDISRIKESIEVLILNMKVYGPGGDKEKFIFTDHKINAERVQDLTLKIEESLHSFSLKERAEIETLKNDINTELINFNSENISADLMRASGSKILGKVSMLNSKFKHLFHKTVEQGA